MNLELEICKITSLDKLFQWADEHIQELHASGKLTRILKDKRRELKHIASMHEEAVKYLNAYQYLS